jgi:hypothetical protein
MKERCGYCEKKLNIINYKCKCEKVFCSKCRMPEEHKCDYDYKDRSELQKKLIKIVASKINREYL